MTKYDDTIEGEVPTTPETWERLRNTPRNTLKLKRLHPSATIPKYQSYGAACFDLHAIDSGIIAPGTAMTFGTGLAVEIPEGWRMDIYSRSGHGFKHGVRLVNCVGKIDADYRGEIKVRLENNGSEPFTVEAGDRIAQAELNRVYRTEFVVVEELSATDRGTGGFGSTGN